MPESYTPGPWKVVVFDGANYVTDADGQPLAMTRFCKAVGTAKLPAAANAALMARAPELLAVLKRALDHSGSMAAFDWVGDAKRLIVELRPFVAAPEGDAAGPSNPQGPSKTTGM